MATSTLIQSLDATYSDGTTSTGLPSHRRQVETFIAGGTIAAGDLVTFDTTKTGSTRVLYVVQTPATAGALVIGVALAAAVSGGKVQVVVEGYVENANVVTGVLKGEGLTTSGATAGRALKYLTGTHTNATAFGVALEDSASNLADIFVFKRF